MSPIRQTIIGSYGLKDVSSEATQGFGRISLGYEYGVNMDLAMIEVNEKIDRILSSLPPEVERPVVKKKKPSDIPVMWIHLTSDIFSMTELSQVVQFELTKRFEQLNGVSQIEANGMVEKSIRLTPKTDKILAAGLDINTIGELIRRSNLPVGQVLVKDGNYEYLIQIENLIKDMSSLASIIVRSPGGQQIPLSELFKIDDAYLNPINQQYFNGKQGIVLAIYHQPDADLFSLERGLLSTLNLLQSEFPSIQFDYAQNQVDLLRDNINQLYITAGLAALFAFIVFFISSKSQRLPLILGTVIPSSILISIGTLWVLGLTLNIITLSGFILGIGLLVDNVIILIEEINQNRNAGMSVKGSCIISARNIFPALLSSTLTTICVFIPLLAIDGIASELFQEQALSLVIILAVSLVLTFILIPTFYSLWIKKKVKDQGWILRLEKWSHRKSMVLRFIVVFLLGAGGFMAIINLKQENLPSYVSNDFQLRIIWNEPVSITENSARVLEIVSGLQCELLSSSIGISSITRNEINYFDEANLYIRLSSPQSLESTRELLANKVSTVFPKASVSSSKPLNPIEMIFYNDAPPAEARIRKNNGNFFTKSELKQLENPDFKGVLNVALNDTYIIVFRKDRVENSRLNYPLLMSHLRNLTDENVVTSIKNPDQSIPVVFTNEDLSYYVLIDSSYYDLATFYDIKDTTEIRTITSDLSGPYISYSGRNLEDVIRYGNEVTANTDWIFDVTGSQLESEQSLRKLLMASVLGIILLYLILVAQFESFTQPLVIFSLIPLSVFGSLIGLFVSGATINIMSIIGMVVMLGIIVNDSILKIDAINRNVKSGLDIDEAILKAKSERFKPILMTSLSTILALIPVLLSSGIASDLQQPLAIVVITGLVIGTWSSITLLPSLYRSTVRKMN